LSAPVPDATAAAVAINGATPTKAALCLRLSAPISGGWQAERSTAFYRHQARSVATRHVRAPGEGTNSTSPGFEFSSAAIAKSVVEEQKSDLDVHVILDENNLHEVYSAATFFQHEKRAVARMIVPTHRALERNLVFHHE
jgi:hypothetical protein